MSKAFNDLFAQINRAKLPPVALWQPDHVGEIDIRIAADGTWFHEGREIFRKGIAKIFSTILRREGEAYFLVTPAEKLRIQVDEVPFVAIDVEAAGVGVEQRVLFKTNLDEVVMLDANHALRIEQRATGPRPFVHVRDSLEARLLSGVFYQLAEFVEDPESEPLTLWSNGHLFQVS
ncbi:MAG: DUF1285 domain-containing protein [Gammaproteobacteria bacterium]|nr:DUF1285 domain-containing protein [Gammaproteobacteria bacterium]